jgi:hypothetical protein
LLSEGIITPSTTVECHSGITDGAIKVGCHQHRSPLDLKEALARGLRYPQHRCLHPFQSASSEGRGRWFLWLGIPPPVAVVGHRAVLLKATPEFKYLHRPSGTAGSWPRCEW